MTPPDETTTDDAEPTDLIPEDVDAELDPNNVDEQIEVTINRLLARVPDPYVRYQVAQGVKEKLPWVMALSAQQLVHELGSVQAAAERIGVTRQYLTRFMKDNEQPTPRQAAKARRSPAQRYGELLALYRRIAERRDRKSGRGDARREFDKLEVNAVAMTTLRPALEQAALRWMKPLHVAAQNTFRKELEEANLAIGDDLPPRLNLQQQSEVFIAMHAARAARRENP